MIPRYLRPVADRKKHGRVSVLEKIVRLLVFYPIIMALFAPAALVLFASVISLGYAPVLLFFSDINGMNNFRLFAFLLAPLSCIAGALVYKYFLPFE
ncbi:hypothetical protein [Brucella thiophenivorans]|nr:hypothetical protein [Brucella thiophenivorans]